MRSRKYETIDAKTIRAMNRHFFTGIFYWRFMLTPIGSRQLKWLFDDGQSNIAYLDIYVFGIRVVRWRV